MSRRKIYVDKQGPFINLDRRKFRPTETSSALSSYNEAYAHFHDRDDKNSATVYVTHQNPQTRRWERAVTEIWTSTDEDPRIRESLAKGQLTVSVDTGRGQRVTVVVGADGYDYGQYRKDNDPSQRKYGDTAKSTRGLNVHLDAKRPAQMTWDEWDDLCKQVQEAREIVPIAPIAAKLEREIALEEELQDYIQKKGLAGG